MAMESHHIVLALAAFTTFLLLSVSEDWRATFCAVGMPAVIYILLVQRSGWSAEKYQLQIENGEKIDAQQASHQKRERERDARIASLEQTVASQAEKLGMAEDAAFHRNTDVFLENSRLKRELRQVAANGVEATTLGNAEVIKRQFDSIRATMADAGYNCASPKDFRLAIERLCNRRPFGAQKLQVAQNVAPVAARSSVPLSDDVERVQSELEAERAAKADIQAKNDKLGEKLSQTAENLRQRSADLEKAQQDLARARDTVQGYEKKMAQMRDNMNSDATAKSRDDEELKCLRALVENHAAQLQEYQNVHNRAYDKTRDEFNAAMESLKSENNRLEALVQSCQEKQNKSTDLKSLQDGVNSDQTTTVFQLKMEIQDLNNDLKAKRAKITGLEADSKRHGNNDDELKKLQKEVFKKEEDLGEQWNKFNKVQQQLTDTQRELKKQNDEVKNLRGQLDRADKECNEVTSKLESLEKEIAGSPSQAKVTK